MGWPAFASLISPLSQAFTASIAYAVDDDPDRHIIVKITAGLLNNPTGPNYGRLNWTLQAIDPKTGERPTDPTRGFLPPNAAPPAGEGYVLFSVQRNVNLAVGDTVGNPTTIVFDKEPPIIVPAWPNTVGSTAPNLAISQSNGLVNVSWPLPGTNYVLEEVNALNDSPTTGWKPVPLPYQTNDTDLFIDVPSPAGNKFYRLRTP